VPQLHVLAAFQTHRRTHIPCPHTAFAVQGPSGSLLYDTRLLPMLVLPVPWTRFDSGGLIMHGPSAVRANRKGMYVQADEEGHMAQLYKGLNTLNALPWYACVCVCVCVSARMPVCVRVYLCVLPLASLGKYGFLFVSWAPLLGLLALHKRTIHIHDHTIVDCHALSSPLLIPLLFSSDCVQFQ